MKPRVAIKVFILQAVAKCDGEPMPEDALVTQTQLALPHLKPKPEEVQEMAQSLVTTGHLVVVKDSLTEQPLYSLTTKGQSAVAQHS
jgi:hypothetical protein